jgi:hypothetical protein
MGFERVGFYAVDWIHDVACSPAVRQRSQNKQLYNSGNNGCCYVITE